MPAPKGPKRLADLIRPALDPILAKRGLAQASLVLDWAAIVGARAAALCEPERLQWPPGGPKSAGLAGAPATLWLRVAPGRGLDVQYGAAGLIERINAHFGWRLVAKVAVSAKPKRLAPITPVISREDPEAQRRAARIAGRADHENLRHALTRLGAAVFTARTR